LKHRHTHTQKMNQIEVNDDCEIMEKLTVDFSVQNSKNNSADLQLLNKKLYDFIQLECTYRKRDFKKLK